MSSNFYFNNFEYTLEQDLIESLVVESIGIYGHDVYFIPRVMENRDEVFNEDAISEYNNAYMLDFYIKSYDSYQGDGAFLSKFNLEIRDQITFTVAKRTFYNEIPVQTIIRPREGDLVYSTMMKRLFVIKYVNKTAVFYQLGSLQTWDLICEVFEYSNERINTGIKEIDDIARAYSFDIQDNGVLTNNNLIVADEEGVGIVVGQFDFDDQSNDVFADNEEFEQESEDVVDWSDRDPFSEDI